MKILNLSEDSKLYTSNVFFILGDWNTVNDINTLIDVGSDLQIISKIENIHTGLGKKKVDQVIITHSHSDHTAILLAIKEAFNPKIYGFNTHMQGIDNQLKDGDILMVADRFFEVYHITSHSYDSICLYCEEDAVLFAGDTNFPIEFENPMLEAENSYILSRLIGKPVRHIYNGHGPVSDYTNKLFKVLK
jgi:glyoxylase-like metal-dependent hydrolase (beta-lactamase superfamily II)